MMGRKDAEGVTAVVYTVCFVIPSALFRHAGDLRGSLTLSVGTSRPPVVHFGKPTRRVWSESGDDMCCKVFSR